MCSTTCPSATARSVKHQLRSAWAQDDHARALDGLRRLAAELDHHHPGAAASLREGLEETVTLTRLGITGNLRTTLQSTNAIESMISILRRTSRNVKRWQSGDMCLRWTAAGMLEAEQQFRKIIGYSDLAKLALAVERRRRREPFVDDHACDRRAGRYARHRLTINRGSSPRSSTALGASSPELLSDAIALHAGGNMRLEEATAHVELGVTLRRDGKRAAAREALTRGADIATACQANTLAGRAREELNILGARPRRLAFSGIDSLTASERRIEVCLTQSHRSRS